MALWPVTTQAQDKEIMLGGTFSVEYFGGNDGELLHEWHGDVVQLHRNGRFVESIFYEGLNDAIAAGPIQTFNGDGGVTSTGDPLIIDWFSTIYPMPPLDFPRFLENKGNGRLFQVSDKRLFSAVVVRTNHNRRTTVVGSVESPELRGAHLYFAAWRAADANVGMPGHHIETTVEYSASWQRDLSTILERQVSIGKKTPLIWRSSVDLAPLAGHIESMTATDAARINRLLTMRDAVIAAFDR
jgi:hypothetical protein